MSKLLNLKKILLLGFIFGFVYIPNVQAKAHSEYCGFMEGNLAVYKGKLSSSASHIADNYDSDAVKAKKNELKKTEDKIKDFCEKLDDYLGDIDDDKKYKNFDDNVYRKQGFFKTKDIEDYDMYLQRFEKILAHHPEFKKEYDALQAEHNKIYSEVQQLEDEQLNKHNSAITSGEYQPCGEQYPFGCPQGQSCFWKEDRQLVVGNRDANYQDGGTVRTKKAICLDPNSKEAKSLVAVKQGEDTYTMVENTSWGVLPNARQVTSVTDEKGEVTVTTVGDSVISRGDNSACNIPTMQNMYQSSCYSCRIILTLITTFMNACGKVYDLTRDAGSKILVIGSMLWLAVFALKLVSSLTNQEPMSIVNDLFIFMFKVAAAYITINVGIGAIVDLFINPLLGAGADYGLGLLQAANQGLIKVALTSHYPYQGTEVISSNTIDKLMALTEGIDKTVSTNLVIGHALTCHAFHAGMITLFDPGKEFAIPVTIRMPDIWIWLCGAAIWFCGFCLTLAIGYYLLDVCFKIGFCVMALPIVIGLWPFGPTSSKFKACMSIIIRSSALFAFLALVVSYALSLVSASLGDLTLFYAKIKAGDAEWISNTFSIFGSSFLLILFAYIYSIHLTGKANDTTGTFFSDNVFGNASPIHHKMTQMTDFAKKTAMAPVKYAGGVVAHQATRAVGGMAKFAVNKAKGMLHSSKSNGGGAGGAVSGAGKGMKAAGQGVEAAGQGMQAAGKGMQAAGQGMKAAGQGITQASQAANAIPIAGQVVAAAGATAGAAVQAAGAATQAAGKGVEAAGKATKAAGKAVKKAGEATEAVGEATQNVENAVKGNSNKDKDEE